MPRLLVTGSSGLVGSACVRHFSALGWEVHGLDGNQRAEYFGPDGDTRRILAALRREVPGFTHHEGDIQIRLAAIGAVERSRPDLVIHAAAQPSHDYATRRPLLDWDVNAGGTIGLLEAVRRYAPEAVFVFLSTNKVYGDAPNYAVEFIERKTRYEADDGCLITWPGFDETLTTDQSRHSIFGASKLAADVMVQEYGRTYGLKTACLRCGCLTGGDHAGAELHGFLAYLARCCREGRPYRVYGHKGKQVRDQLHAFDVARACEEIGKAPRVAEVYNLGGGRANSVSVLEAIALVEQATGKKLDWSYMDEPRGGDHVVYYSDTRKFRTHYPEWSVTRSLADIVGELCGRPTPCEV